MPCARMSGLCGGLAALIAGVFAISFLTTHASADADPCVGVDCGLEATCFALSATESVCSCNKDGFSFIEADRTCFAPLVRTTVALQPKGVSKVDVTFRTKLPAEQASGTTACGSTYVKVQGITKITVVWNASNPVATGRPAPSNAMCKSLSFYSDWDCTQKLDFTAIARPAKAGRSYPVTKKTFNVISAMRSVGCETTTCHKDCGAADCVVKDGQQQCQCPEGLLFNAAKKLCLAPKCKPACSANTQCTWVGGKSVCQ